MSKKDDSFDMDSPQQSSGGVGGGSGGGSKKGLIVLVLAALAVGGFLIFNGAGKKPLEAKQAEKIETAAPDAAAKTSDSKGAAGQKVEAQAPQAPANNPANPIVAASQTEKTATEKNASKTTTTQTTDVVASSAVTTEKHASSKKQSKGGAAKKLHTAAASSTSATDTVSDASQINFEFNKAEIRPSDADKLKAFSQTLKNSASLSIVGHADNVGVAEINAHISRDRAVTVAAYLRKLGVKNKIVIKGMGSTKPAADNATDEGRAQNRRVELSAVN